MKEKHINIRVEQCLALAKASACTRRTFGALLDAQAAHTAAPTGPAAPLDPATRARLKALGYAD